MITFRYSDVFRGYRKATPGCNGLTPPEPAMDTARNHSYSNFSETIPFMGLIIIQIYCTFTTSTSTMPFL